jgi:hypothetical protein
MTSTMQTIKHWRKKLKKELGNEKTSHVRGLAELNCENGYTTERNPQIQYNAHQSSNVILCRNRKEILLKFIWKPKSPWTEKVISSKKCKAGDTTIQGFELYYRVIVTKTVWYRHKRDAHQIKYNTWSRNKSTQLQTSDFWQRYQKHVREKTTSSKNVVKTGYQHAEDWN